MQFVTIKFYQLIVCSVVECFLFNLQSMRPLHAKPPRTLSASPSMGNE